MEDFIVAGIEGCLLAKLNIFRPDLHATCKSNISTGEVKAVLTNTLKDKKNWTLDQYIWPPQPSPHLKLWNNWKADLTPTYNLLGTIVLSPSIKLVT